MFHVVVEKYLLKKEIVWLTTTSGNATSPIVSGTAMAAAVSMSNGAQVALETMTNPIKGVMVAVWTNGRAAAAVKAIAVAMAVARTNGKVTKVIVVDKALTTRIMAIRDMVARAMVIKEIAAKAMAARVTATRIMTVGQMNGSPTRGTVAIKAIVAVARIGKGTSVVAMTGV